MIGCERGKEPVDDTRGGELLVWLSDCHRLKRELVLHLFSVSGKRRMSRQVD